MSGLCGLEHGNGNQRVPGLNRGTDVHYSSPETYPVNQVKHFLFMLSLNTPQETFPSFSKFMISPRLQYRALFKIMCFNMLLKGKRKMKRWVWRKI